MTKSRSQSFSPIIEASIRGHGNDPDTEERQIRDANVILEALLADFKTEDEAKTEIAKALQRQGLDATNHNCSGAISHLYPEAVRRRGSR